MVNSIWANGQMGSEVAKDTGHPKITRKLILASGRMEKFSGMASIIKKMFHFIRGVFKTL